MSVDYLVPIATTLVILGIYLNVQGTVQKAIIFGSYVVIGFIGALIVGSLIVNSMDIKAAFYTIHPTEVWLIYPVLLISVEKMYKNGWRIGECLRKIKNKTLYQPRNPK